MKTPIRDRYLIAWALASLLLAIGSVPHAAAQVGTASAALNGIVRDSSGAVVPGATVSLRDTRTGFEQVTKSNDTGNYSLVNIIPGSYEATVTMTGFATARTQEFNLAVNQTATINFTLQVGAATTTISVAANAVQIETSTAELGTVISSTEVNALPLNGRNFTELLLLSPGVSPVNATENSGFGGIGNPVGTVVLPSVNGQNNRSNMYLLDGINNYGAIRDTYAVQPTLDDIEEFKVQSHNDEAQFGQVLGGIVNVVTKSGTNEFHGDAWEFLRNDAMDAANYFNPIKTPLKQNQFGAGAGGPVLLPHYNGHDKTFFYASYEGYRNNTASSNFYRTPTAAQLAGDFSNLDSQGIQLYNPFSSVPQPDSEAPNATGFDLQPFMCDGMGNPLPANGSGIQPSGTPCNKIPAGMLDTTMVNYAKTFFPAPETIANQPQFNGLDTTPNITDQDQVSVRVDEQLTPTNRFFVRWTSAWEPITGSNGYPGAVSVIHNSEYNIAANWTHTFGASSVLQFTFGRVSAQNNRTPYFNNTPSSFYQSPGFSTYLYNHAPFGGTQVPSASVANYLGAENYIGRLHYSNIWEYRGDWARTVGRHSIRTGASLATDGWEQPFFGSENDFDVSQTQDGNLDSNTGDPMASMVLGVPTYSEVDNVYSLLHGGRITGLYFQDQWRMSEKLTMNLGLRYDLTVNPREGKASNKSNITGDFDFSNGTYILQGPAPACSPSQGAPCIPGGALPADVTIAKNGKIIHDNYDNIQPRFGFAYRLTAKTVMHGGYGRFFDNWAGVTENQSNYTQTWPNIAFVGAPGGFNLYGPPTGLAQDPFGFGNVGASEIPPASSPFSPLNTNAYTDPHLKNGYSDQWNFGFEREMATGIVTTVNYVGSRNARIATAVTANALTSPGGNAPYSYIPQTPYTESLSHTTYNSLQVSSEIHLRSGITSTLAYTWSKALTTGCDGYNSGCEIQNPYDLAIDRGPAAYDLPQIFAGSFVLPLPFGTGMLRSRSGIVNQIIGGWQLNGIVSLNSGPRYDVQDDNGISNINNFYGAERADETGDPHASTSAYPLSKLDPININAFTDPAAGTFGTMGRNSLRADWGRNLDASFFRSFKVNESKRFEFRAEAFNATNTPVFAAPDTFLPDGPGFFGVVTSTANTARQLQVALKFYF
ncbi:MAG TPA: TonB-dependent receptor [Acidobacteriaceae bacterium]